MNFRKKLIIGAVAAAALFLVGFVPQYLKAAKFREELRAAQLTMAANQQKVQVAALRDQMGLMYLETNRKNFGLARQYATQFFSQAREVANATADAELKAALERVLQRRDDVTSGLTAGDGAIRDVIEAMYEEVHKATVRAQQKAA